MIKLTALTLYELLSVIVSLIAIILSIRAFSFSKKSNNLSSEANNIAKEANRISVEIFQRDGVVDLPTAWKDMRHVITPDNEIIGPSAVQAANALHATATAWNHDIGNKSILFAQYWPGFKEIYEQIQNDNRLIPGLTITLKSVISPEIKKAYKEMTDYELNNVNQTRILK